jgi:hypothetical protein
MASAEAGRFASLSEEDFEFNLVDQFFKLVRIVVKTCLLLIFVQDNSKFIVHRDTNYFPPLRIGK